LERPTVCRGKGSEESQAKLEGITRGWRSAWSNEGGDFSAETQRGSKVAGGEVWGKSGGELTQFHFGCRMEWRSGGTCWCRGSLRWHFGVGRGEQGGFGTVAHEEGGGGVTAQDVRVAVNRATTSLNQHAWTGGSV
jgi:hypothetical protein